MGPARVSSAQVPEAATIFLPLTPDEALVVDVARGLDSGSMIEQAHRILTYEGTRGNIYKIETEIIQHTFYVNNKTSQV